MPADAGERREHAQRLIWQATRDIERLEAELRERGARQEAFATPALLALGTTRRATRRSVAVQRGRWATWMRELEIAWVKTMRGNPAPDRPWAHAR